MTGDGAIHADATRHRALNNGRLGSNHAGSIAPFLAVESLAQTKIA